MYFPSLHLVFTKSLQFNDIAKNNQVLLANTQCTFPRIHICGSGHIQNSFFTNSLIVIF